MNRISCITGLRGLISLFRKCLELEETGAKRNQNKPHSALFLQIGPRWCMVLKEPSGLTPQNTQLLGQTLESSCDGLDTHRAPGRACDS